MEEKYYYGQGKVWTRKIGGKWRWWGDVSSLTLAAEIEKVEHRESYSGQKGLARSFKIGTTMTLSATVRQLDTAALAEGLYGEATEIATGAVSAEEIGAVAAGDVIKLDYGGVSALVIKDSTPVVIDAEHYVLDPRFGSVEFVSLPSSPAPTMPLTAAYSYAGGRQVNFMTKAAPTMQFRYEGVNLAEGNAPVIVEIYKLSTDPLSELALITDGTELAGMTLTCPVLIDSSKPAGGALGQFGRFIEVTPAP